MSHKVKEDVLREISFKCAEMANNNLNELIDYVCKTLIKYNNFNNLDIPDIIFVYQTILGGYKKGLDAALNLKTEYALKSINDPSKLLKSMHDPEFAKWVKELHKNE